MDAGAVLTRLAATIDAHDWDGLPALLHPDFTCRLVHTGETFDRDGWVRFNADYPVFQRFEVQDLVSGADRAVLLGRVTGLDTRGAVQVFAVASFATVVGDVVTELTEVWTDVDQEVPAGTRPG